MHFKFELFRLTQRLITKFFELHSSVELDKIYQAPIY